MQKFNNWNVPFSVISWFETALSRHDKVATCERSDDIKFTVRLKNGTTLRVLLVYEYCLGLAAVLRARGEFPDAEYIVTGGNWNGYTPEAKEHGRRNSIGIFNAGEFFGALNWADPKSYYKEDRSGKPTYSYKNS